MHGMPENPNPYESPNSRIDSRRHSITAGKVLLACLLLLAIAAACLLGRNLAARIGLLGAMVFLGCFVWLHARVVKDGAAPDVMLLLCGVSSVAYVFTNWQRAKWPFLGTVGGLAAALVASALR
jgi:hypothetical protein